MALCHVEGDQPDRQRECRILDISEFGVGLHLRRAEEDDDLVGRRVAVESPTMGASVTIRLEGTVRYVVSTDDDVLRRVGAQGDDAVDVLGPVGGQDLGDVLARGTHAGKVRRGLVAGCGDGEGPSAPGAAA